MGGAAYPRAVSTKDLRGLSVAHGRTTGKPTAERSEIMMWAGRPASLACSGDRRLKVVLATTYLLSRGPLGVRRWAGRPSCHSLVREPRASPGPDRLGRARTGRELHTHQVERAVNPVQSRRDACRASVLMKLSLIGRAAVPRGASGGRTATAAMDGHGRPEAIRA